MRRLIKSYTSFLRPERNGLIALCLLLAMLVALRFMAKEHENEIPGAARILAAHRQQIESFSKTSPKRKQTETNFQQPESPVYQQRSWPSSESKESWSAFDPNTVDSLTLRRFGLKPHTIANLMKWRAKGKRFYKAEDLKPLYTLTTEQYNMLAPYIHIKLQQIDLNNADSATLVKLRGIGPKLAHKIITRRNTTGPFTHHEQLKELYNFPDAVWEELVKELKPLKSDPLME